MIRRAATAVRLAAALACCVFVTGCEVKNESHRRAMSVEVGIVETQVLAVAGPPSRAVQARGECKTIGGVRELLYDATTVYFGGLSESIDGTIALCLDGKGIVIDTVMIQF